MDMIQYNLFRIQLATIRNQAKDLSEIDIEDAKKRMSLIKKNINVCEHLLEEEF